ncbi:unnamed protein product [Bursaphelenchus xylophilus]|uniref:(pine wood nematode) hypothetical protein n=1 Tax=Bursaphelenchus xylophilus TaxID=6326 RepID=A0A1I7RWD0_BURXY|nr:unnamed protein product [Bursaphelenchus xylophilus]CAG9095481.1 unnamed protein product [Bursaphelenchus xylophilus]
MLTLFVFLALMGSAQASDYDCDRIPPALWCRHPTLIKECGWDVPCNKYLAKSKGQKIQLTVLYEALCDACQEFITGELQKIYSKFGDKVDIELVPAGNAHFNPDGSIHCQHLEEECKGNKYEACAIKYIKEAVPFIGCVEQDIENGLEQAVEKCFKKFQTDAGTIDNIKQCYNSQEGEDLAKAHVTRTLNVQPDNIDNIGVPYLVFNNVSLNSIQFFEPESEIKQWYVKSDSAKETGKKLTRKGVC